MSPSTVPRSAPSSDTTLPSQLHLRAVIYSELMALLKIHAVGDCEDARQHLSTYWPRNDTVLKPVPGSGSRAKCAQFRGSSYAKHVSSWFQPWATLWPTCHMLVPASLLQSVECSTECKNSIFHCTIGCNKYKSSLASGASPQTPPGGLFLPPGPPPPAWVHAAHRHGMVSPRKVWFQRPCSSLVLVPEEVVEPASGRYNDSRLWPRSRQDCP